MASAKALAAAHVWRRHAQSQRTIGIIETHDRPLPFDGFFTRNHRDGHNVTTVFHFSRNERALEHQNSNLTATMSSSLFSLEGKVAVVTGGSGTLGSSMCMALAAAGAKVGILGRRADALATVVAAVEAAGGEALALQADVLDKAQLEAARDAIVAKWGGVHILVNGAGCVVRVFALRSRPARSRATRARRTSLTALSSAFRHRLLLRAAATSAARR